MLESKLEIVIYIGGVLMKEEKKEIKITGYDIAYYSSIIIIIASIVLAVLQVINKTK